MRKRKPKAKVVSGNYMDKIPHISEGHEWKPDLTLTPSSTPPIPPCWAAAAWTAPSTAPPDRSCWRSAARSTAAKQGRPSSPQPTACPAAMLSIPPVPSGGAADTARHRCWPPATAILWRWRRSTAAAVWTSPPSPPVSMAIPCCRPPTWP